MKTLVLVLLLCACPCIVHAQTAPTIVRAEKLRETEKFADAQKLLEQQLAKTKVKAEQDDLQNALSNMHFVWARKLENQYDFEGAIAHYLKAYETDKVLRRPFAATDLHNIGAAYRKSSQSEKAFEFYNQALIMYRTVQDKQGEAAVLNNIGALYWNLSESEKALEFFNQALLIRRVVQDREGEAGTLNNIGAAYNSLSQPEKALEFFNQALPLRRAIQDQKGEAVTLNNIGAAYLRLSQYAKALEFYNQALPIYRALQDQQGEAITLINIGAVYGNLNQYEKALESYSQTLPLLQAVQDQKVEAVALTNIGHAYDNLGQPEKALEFYSQALPLRRVVQDRQGEAATLNNIGAAYRSLNQFDNALEFYNQALIIQRVVQDRQGEAGTLNNIGFAHYSLSRYEEALRYYEQALPIFREIKDRTGEATTLNNIMFVQIDREQPTLAILFGKQSVNVKQFIRRDMASLDETSRDAYLKGNEDTYQILARLLIEQGRAREAEEVLAMAQQQDFLGFIGRDVRGVRLESSSNEYNGAEKIVVAQQNARVESVAKLSAEVFLLSGLETPDAAQKARLTQARASLGTARAQLDAFFAAMPQRFARNAGDVAADRNELSTIVPLLREIGQQTGGKVALVSALVDDKGLELLLTLPSGQTVNLSYAADAKQLNGQSFPVWLQAQITSFKSDILQRAPVENAATELWNVVGCQGALGAQLEGAQIDTVMWRLTGPLRALPLAALRDKDGYLVEKYRNVVLTAGSSELNLAHQPVGNWRALGVGVTKAWNVKGDQFSALTGVTSELKAVMDAPKDGFVGGVLPGRVLMDAEFSESNFFRLLRGATPESNAPWQVVHIASHFKLAGDDLKSFLLTGDGALTLAALKERAQTRPLFPGVELMTLSACDTAGGADNLGALAELNGARSVLATLWPVADKETAQLMSDFYATHAAQPAAGKVAALQSAQLKLLRAGGKSAHPYYWAPFVLMGNPR